MPNPTRQAITAHEPSGQRILDALKSRDDVQSGREVPWLMAAAGLPDSTIRDAIKRGPSRADVAVKIAKAIGVDLEWLLTGATLSRDKLAARVAEAEDWVPLPRYVLSEFVDSRKPQPVGDLPVLKPLLDRTLRLASGLWVTEMPSDALPEVAAGGETIICRDCGLDSPEPADGAVYLFLINGNPVVRRVAVELGRILLTASDSFTAPMAVELDEIGRGIVLLGRVVGAFSLHKV